ncbi:hypothetical protein J3R83DRAFT_7562 [Lanmaoa asiatica]|nr:hypothetical protein J3R83DRAFT_7562 [Lanmaoa asiatica]
MHSAAASRVCTSTSSSDAHHCSRDASSILVTMRHGHDDPTTFVNANAPQCCHCGYRGSHSPSCPFR